MFQHIYHSDRSSIILVKTRLNWLNGSQDISQFVKCDADLNLLCYKYHPSISFMVNHYFSQTSCNCLVVDIVGDDITSRGKCHEDLLKHSHFI